MRSRTTRRFREAFNRLPNDIQSKARRAFEIWKGNPSHPSLKYKLINQGEQIYSVRIGLRWRALGVREDDVVTWFWIGSHSEYDQLIFKI